MGFVIGFELHYCFVDLFIGGLVSFGLVVVLLCFVCLFIVLLRVFCCLF